ncbi:hypothetical protein B7463_g2361, partial [Scytalidium lignicola]
MSDLDTPPAPYLAPEDQTVVNEFAASGEPPLQDLSVQEFRKFFDQLQEHTPIPGVTETEIKVPFGAKGKEFVKTFIFRADNTVGDLPVIFYIHGGGWISGDHISYDSISRELALRSGCAVVFPEYTLAPEKKFPVQNEQCFTALKYVAKHGKSLGLKTEKFAIAGDSAGGQLSPAVINLVNEAKLEKSIPIVFQILFNPFVDVSNLPNNLTLSEFEFVNGPFLTLGLTEEVIHDYIPNPKDRKSILASPLLMTKEQVSHQPPTMVVVSEVDVLRTGGEQFAKLLQTSGVRCGLVRAEAQLHDPVVIEPIRNGPTAHALVLMAAALFNEALAPSPTAGVKRPREEENSDKEKQIKKVRKVAHKRRRRS